MRQLEFILNGMETRRYHGWPVLRQENVAQHQYMVAMFVYLIVGQTEGIRVPLLMAALTHDLPEWITGDPPSPMKRAMGDEFRAKWSKLEDKLLRTVQLDFDHMLDDEERRILKLADYFSGAAYCVRERQMGNQLIDPAFATFAEYIPTYITPLSDDVPFDPEEPNIEHEIWNYLLNKWLDAGGTRTHTPDYYKFIQEYQNVNS